MAQPQFTGLNESMLDLVDDLHLAPAKFCPIDLFSVGFFGKEGKYWKSDYWQMSLFPFFGRYFLQNISSLTASIDENFT